MLDGRFKMLYNIRKEDKDEDRETLTGRNEITGYNAKGACDEVVDITTDGFTVGDGGKRTELWNDCEDLQSIGHYAKRVVWLGIRKTAGNNPCRFVFGG